MRMFAAMHKSAFGTKRTSPSAQLMSAFGGKADIAFDQGQNPKVSTGANFQDQSDLMPASLTIFPQSAISALM